MKKIIFYILILILAVSCYNPFWNIPDDGEPDPQSSVYYIDFPQIIGAPLDWDNYDPANNTITISSTDTLIFELDAPEQYESGSIQWFINGVLEYSGTDPFTFIPTAFDDYDQRETYILTLYVKKGVVPYSRIIRIEVLP